MRHFFSPRSVVVVGANRERGKIGAEVLHNLVAGGYTGSIAAVHPSAKTIDGVPAYASVSAVPEAVDLAIICVPAALVPAVVDDCLVKGVKALVVISAGFREIGPVGAEREAAIVSKVRDAGVRMVGPNCMGLINTDPAVRLNATFAPAAPPAGRVAMSTQSGALGLAILDYARQLHIGISTFVSVGNKADVSSNDLLQYWADDPNTDVILLYLESFGNPRKFSQLARQIARRKPIVAVKAGRSRAGARAASSHTGALASRDVIVDALFRQAGVIRTNTLEELFDVAALLAHQPVPRGRRVAILTNAGGPGILAADACEANGMTLPALSDATIAALRSFLPAAASVSNPIDMLASAPAAHFERALEIVLQDDGVDSVLVIFIPPLVTRESDVAQAIRRASATHPGKTLAAIVMSAKGAPPELAPVPCFIFPEAAAVALTHAAEHGEWLRRPLGSPPVFADVDRVAVRRIVDAALSRGSGWLAADEAQRLIGSVGIPVSAARTVRDAEEAASIAARLGFPVVLKAAGRDILHKSDIGGVVLGLTSETAVTEAWREMKERVGARMEAGVIQKMAPGGVEMLIGASHDPTFGPVIACALGGTLAELLADSQFRLHPVTEDEAASMIDGLRGARLLRGFRGAPVADEAALRDALLRLSTLIDICPEIRELDINPIRVFTGGACALDVRVRIEHPVAPHADT
jgi:acetyl coenzyme A synthetase (ADP forming)-like protein